MYCCQNLLQNDSSCAICGHLDIWGDRFLGSGAKYVSKPPAALDIQMTGAIVKREDGPLAEPPAALDL